MKQQHNKTKWTRYQKCSNRTKRKNHKTIKTNRNKNNQNITNNNSTMKSCHHAKSTKEESPKNRKRNRSYKPKDIKQTFSSVALHKIVFSRGKAGRLNRNWNEKKKKKKKKKNKLRQKALPEAKGSSWGKRLFLRGKLSFGRTSKHQRIKKQPKDPKQQEGSNTTETTKII